MPWAIILAGSHVWQEDSLEAVCPRALLPIANSPLIHYTLAWLRAAGVRAATLCSNDAAVPLQDCLLDGAATGVELYYYADHIPRGPAGCARDAALASDAGLLVVVEGAVLPELDLKALIVAHQRSQAAATVVVSGADGERGPAQSCLSPVGLYVFARSALEHVPRSGFQDIKETLIPRLHEAGALVVGHPVARPFPRVRGRESYLAAHAWALERIYARRLTRDGYQWRRDAYVHHTARLAERARLVPPLMIGPGVHIEDDAVLVGPSVLGRRCVVGRGAIIERSVLWEGCVVGARVVVDQAVLATGVSISSGAVRRCVAMAPVARN